MTAMLLAGALVGLGVTLVDCRAAHARAGSCRWCCPAVGDRSGPGHRRRAPRPCPGQSRATGRRDAAPGPASRGPGDLRHNPDPDGAGEDGLRVRRPCLPGVLTSILSIAGLALPVVIPVLAGRRRSRSGCRSCPRSSCAARAAVARVQMRRTVCVYLELVALERAADAGAVEALERAAAIGDGPGFGHIRDALLRARLEGRTPWQQLSELALELDVPELGDVADIMRLSGEDGAAVLPTLRARAASLRTWLLQSEVTAANEASERMSIPVALLGVAFMALLGFPAFWRILFG